jgi:hypothetical protein
MAEYNKDPSLASELQDMKRRLANLERSPRLTSASISDPAGVVRVRLGRLNDDGTDFGIIVADQNGADVFEVSGVGMSAPYIPVTVSDAGTFDTVTAGTFTATRWHLQAETMSHAGLYAWMLLYADAGTNGEVRITCPGLGTATSPIVVTGTGASSYSQFRWLHGSAMNVGPVQFSVEARRTAGAGAFRVYEPPSAALAAAGLCTATGL